MTDDAPHTITRRSSAATSYIPRMRNSSIDSASTRRRSVTSQFECTTATGGAAAVNGASTYGQPETLGRGKQSAAATDATINLSTLSAAFDAKYSHLSAQHHSLERYAAKLQVDQHALQIEIGLLRQRNQELEKDKRALMRECEDLKGLVGEMEDRGREMSSRLHLLEQRFSAPQTAAYRSVVASRQDDNKENAVPRATGRESRLGSHTYHPVDVQEAEATMLWEARSDLPAQPSQQQRLSTFSTVSGHPFSSAHRRGFDNFEQSNTGSLAPYEAAADLMARPAPSVAPSVMGLLPKRRSANYGPPSGMPRPATSLSNVTAPNWTGAEDPVGTTAQGPMLFANASSRMRSASAMNEPMAQTLAWSQSQAQAKRVISLEEQRLRRLSSAHQQREILELQAQLRSQRSCHANGAATADSNSTATVATRTSSRCGPRPNAQPDEETVRLLQEQSRATRKPRTTSVNRVRSRQGSVHDSIPAVKDDIFSNGAVDEAVNRSVLTVRLQSKGSVGPQGFALPQVTARTSSRSGTTVATSAGVRRAAGAANVLRDGSSTGLGHPRGPRQVSLEGTNAASEADEPGLSVRPTLLRVSSAPEHTTTAEKELNKDPRCSSDIVPSGQLTVAEDVPDLSTRSAEGVKERVAASSASADQSVVIQSEDVLSRIAEELSQSGEPSSTTFDGARSGRKALPVLSHKEASEEANTAAPGHLSESGPAIQEANIPVEATAACSPSATIPGALSPTMSSVSVLSGSQPVSPSASISASLSTSSPSTSIGAHRRLYLHIQSTLSASDLAKFERYIYRYDGMEIPIDGPRGLVNRVKKLLLLGEPGLREKGKEEEWRRRKDLAREFEKIVRAAAAQE